MKRKKVKQRFVRLTEWDRLDLQWRAQEELAKRQRTEDLQFITERVLADLRPKPETNHDARWHGAHAALQALMHAGAIKEQYVLFIREHLAMRREAVFQINGIAILPPDVPR